MRYIVMSIIVLTTLPIAFLVRSDVWRLDLPNVSTFPIIADETPHAVVNIISIIGGVGLRNGKGRSKNYLVKQKYTFIDEGLNYYLLPNWEKSEKASYAIRASDQRAERILGLVKKIRERNSKPIWLMGFSRGSVDVGYFAKRYASKIDGIVLASAVYENSSKKAEFYSMEEVIGDEINTPVLVAHHADDTCIVTQYGPAKNFFDNLKAPRKYFLKFIGGDATGRECGPLNHHGFEGIEEKVAREISIWIKKLSK